MKTNRTRKNHFLKTHQSRRNALSFGVFLVWLLLVIFLPKDWSNGAAVVGFLYGMCKWYQWGDDPKGYPKWGCFLQVKQASFEFEIDRSLTREQKAQIKAIEERQSLLRAAEAESQTEVELLRPATHAGELKPGEMLRSSDKHDSTSPSEN